MNNDPAEDKIIS